MLIFTLFSVCVCLPDCPWLWLALNKGSPAARSMELRVCALIPYESYEACCALKVVGRKDEPMWQVKSVRPSRGFRAQGSV